MKLSLSLVLISFVVISIAEISLAASVADIDWQQRDAAFRFKRSLCNTFGGCGAKRSIQAQNRYIGGRNAADMSDKGALYQQKKESTAQLVAEIFNDLLEYMQTNEKYKSGKYVIVLPKLGGDGSSLSSSEEDIQELQVVRS